ncbi:sigma factor-like helix-turn-helix DNA-binding protein [Capnocytophaga sp.]|uniref:helix-turn-helix transcriptional regulator n=1 Tax=Capnocytophaga sp. TaxID=44737 RepID=UPI0026DCA68A|nr:sigma factor-like helix-turn-helix DNA-binding protein [Capnocytophaga sp.]MDO5104600.1 sigma factor-like helix-turn-helix DNA-binding protein [Capnocytophaga sp.]
MQKNYQTKSINSRKAFEYYCKGLNSKEIAKLLNCSYRTVQNYMSAENWKEKRANKLKDKGLL